jgi:hypothetical protein
MGPFVTEEVQLLHENGMVTMVTKLNPWSHVNCYKFYVHLRTLNVRSSETDKATRLKNGAEFIVNDLTSLLNFIKVCQFIQKLLVSDTQTARQTDLNLIFLS